MFLSLPNRLHSRQLIRSSLCSFAMGATGYRCASAFSNPLTLLSQATTSELAFLHERLSFSAHDVVYVLLRPCLFPFTILSFRASGGRHEIYRQVSSTSFVWCSAPPSTLPFPPAAFSYFSRPRSSTPAATNQPKIPLRRLIAHLTNPPHPSDSLDLTSRATHSERSTITLALKGKIHNIT